MARVTNGNGTSALFAENAALRAELEHYRSIVDHLPTGVFIYQLEDRTDDRSLRILAVNPSVEGLVGLMTADLEGKTLDESFPGLREQGLPQAYADVVRTGRPLSRELVYRDEQVINRAFMVQARPLPGDRLVVYLDDITARKQAELELQQLNNALEARITERTVELERSQSLLRHLLTSSPSAVYLKDLEGRFLLLNQQAAVLMGHSPEELVGRADHELFPEVYVNHWRAAERAVLETRGRIDQEEQAPQTDGVHTFLSSRAPVFNEEGEIYAISGISTDITLRIRAEEALRESQQLLETLFDHLPVAIILKDARDGRFVLWNIGSEKLFGLKAGDVVGKTDYEIFPHEQAVGFVAKDREVLASKQPELIPEEFVDSAILGRRTIRTTKIPILDQQGVPSHLLVICTDLTDEKASASERALLQVQIIEAQQHALRELSTPLLPLSNKVVLMPIIGAIDSNRAHQVMETLLEGVSAYNAAIAILDITGVQVVDTQVANAFIQAARAVQLLGARVMLTGIRPEVAQTLVQLGVDLQGVMTRGSLQAGIAYAFAS